MLNLKQAAIGFDRGSRGLSEVLPWLIQIAPGLVLNKDGGLLACFEMGGMPVEGSDDIAIDRGADLFEQSLRNMDGRVTMWFTVLRREFHEYPEGSFANAQSAAIDQLYRQEISARQRYINRHYLSVLFSVNEQRDGFFGALAQAAGEGEGLILQRLWETALRQLLHEEAFLHDASQLKRRMERFEEMLAQFVETLLPLRLKRLEGTALNSFLHEMASPASAGDDIPNVPASAYLDTALGGDRIVIAGDHLRFEGAHKVCLGAGLAVKAWPGATFPGMLDSVLSAPAELTLSQAFRFVDHEEAKRYIKNVQRFHLNLQKSIFSYVREAISGEESVVRDTGRAVSAEDARQALTDMVGAQRLFGYLNLTVLVLASSQDALEEALSSVASGIRAQGYLLLRERLHLNSAWSGTLPGQWGELVRWHFISTANWADLCPIRTASTGFRENRYLTQQTGRQCPALSLFSTAAGGPYHFNFHHRDLAHAIVIGPSRSGKSVWVNFLLSQFQKYHPVRTVIFDKDRSCRIPTLLQGGQCIEVGEPTLQLNPVKLVSQALHRPWLGRWVEILLTAHGRSLSAGDRQAVGEALEGMAHLSAEFHQLSSLHGLLPRHLRAELDPWISGGALGALFDHVEDSFSLSAFTCIEMGSVLKDHRIARAFLEYAFYRVERALAENEGIPTLIYVEEAWFMLSDAYFSNRIRDWLKTIPKKLGSVVLATQSLDDFSKSDIFSTIADNIPTRVFLPNRNARVHRDLYRNQFGLNDAQILRIEQAQDKRHYYVSTPEASHLLEICFPPALLSWLRSDVKALAVFERHRTSGRPDWTSAYLEEMVHAS